MAAAQARAQDVDSQWQLQLSVDHHVDAAPLNALGRDDVWTRMAPRPGRNLAYLFDEASLTRQSGDWRWSLLARQRATVVANPDALALGRVVEVTGRPTLSQQWAVQALAQGFAGAGLRAGRGWAWGSGWRVQGGAQLLGLTRYFERGMQGDAAYDATQQSYHVNLVTQRADDRLQFPYQQPHAATGQGLLLDAGLAWSDGPAAVSLAVRDAGWLRWAALPQQVATLNTELTTVDADGFVVYQPVVQGRNTQTAYRRWLVPISELQASWQSNEWGRWSAGATWLPGWGALPRVGWQQQLGDWGLNAGWRLHERRAELGVVRGHWRVALGADAIGPERSMAWSLAWSSASLSPGP